jgi:hypothetical protein
MESQLDYITQLNLDLFNLLPHIFWDYLGFFSGVCLFILILWQRVHGDVFKVNPDIPYFATKLAQLGLAMQGFMAVLLMVDSVNSCLTDCPPKILFIIFAFATLLSKTSYSVLLWKAISGFKVHAETMS